MYYREVKHIMQPRVIQTQLSTAGKKESQTVWTPKINSSFISGTIDQGCIYVYAYVYVLFFLKLMSSIDVQL